MFISLTWLSFHPQSNEIIEHFHRSLNATLHSPLADSDWFLPLPLVLLGLHSIPKEDTGFSFSEAVFGAPLSAPGEFLDSLELASFSCLQKIERAVAGFAFPLPHHVLQSPPFQLPPALMTAKFVIVLEDDSFCSLATSRTAVKVLLPPACYLV